MATQLSLYNGALRALGQTRLSSTSEARESRRLLDDAWDDAARKYCLEQGQWKFALRSSSLTSDPDVTPAFGYAYAFQHPSDFVRLAGIASDEFFNAPLTRYADEAGWWYADIDPLYLKYVSNDTSYGYDYSLWPETFTRWAEHYLALQIAPKLTLSEKLVDRVEKMARRLLIDARSKDAMAGPVAFPPQGGWVSARTGGSSRNDRGSQSRLIG